MNRTDAPSTLSEQEQDVYACLSTMQATLHRCLYQHADAYEIQTAINRADTILACLEQVAEDRKEVAA